MAAVADRRLTAQTGGLDDRGEVDRPPGPDVVSGRLEWISAPSGSNRAANTSASWRFSLRLVRYRLISFVLTTKSSALVTSATSRLASSFISVTIE